MSLNQNLRQNVPSVWQDQLAHQSNALHVNTDARTSTSDVSTARHDVLSREAVDSIANVGATMLIVPRIPVEHVLVEDGEGEAVSAAFVGLAHAGVVALREVLVFHALK